METTGLIVPVGMAVLKQAAEQLQRWHQQGWTELSMSVNLSVRQFSCPTLLADIDQILAETGVNPGLLKLEITESAIMDNAEMAIDLTQNLRSRSIQISIDDFGTGYSSLAYLKLFPIHILKIDRSFVKDIETDENDAAICEMTMLLAQKLGLQAVAEGVETRTQLDFLSRIGCQWIQGYLFSKPLPAGPAGEFLATFAIEGSDNITPT